MSRGGVGWGKVLASQVWGTKFGFSTHIKKQQKVGCGTMHLESQHQGMEINGSSELVSQAEMLGLLFNVRPWIKT